MIERHLKETEHHVVRGKEHIARQREIIAQLQHDGHDSTQAEELLATLEQTQLLHTETRDRIRDELRDA